MWEKVEELLSNEKVAMAILAGAKKRFSSNPHEREIKFNLGKSHFEREIFLNQESSLAFYKETKQNVRGSWPSPNIKKAHKNFLVGFSSNTLTSGDHGKD